MKLTDAPTIRCCGPEYCGEAAWPPGTADIDKTEANKPILMRRYCIGNLCAAWRWTRILQSGSNPPQFVFSSNAGYCGHGGPE